MCTTKAFEATRNLKIESNKINVRFSDYNKRPEIIGDVLGYNLTFENYTTLFVAFSVNSRLPSSERIENIFSRYGKVRAIYTK